MSLAGEILFETGGEIKPFNPGLLTGATSFDCFIWTKK